MSRILSEETLQTEQDIESEDLMLPVVTDTAAQQLMETLQQGPSLHWQKQMIHHLKTENPEINTLILQIANQSEDPRKVMEAGYVVYKALEIAAQQEEEENALLLVR